MRAAGSTRFMSMPRGSGPVRIISSDSTFSATQTMTTGQGEPSYRLTSQTASTGCEIVGQDVKDTATLGVGVAAGLRKEDAKLRDALNKAFGEMMTDGTYKKINEKYFPFALN